MHTLKIGITYLYTIFKYGYPPNPRDDFRAIAEIGKMGFRFLEMEGLGREHTNGIWKNRRALKKCLQDHGIHVHNFCCVDPELVSLNDKKRKAAYERFKRTAELGVFLGAETLHLASYAPPVKYLKRSPYQLGKNYSFAEAQKIRIPEGFSWSRIWDTLVESCRFAADIGAKYERTVIMEPRVGEIICSVDSMIRLIKDVAKPNFKANFDTAHFSAQRENVPLALTKMAGLFANIHIADNNPVNTLHLAIGKGTIDWDEFFRILIKMNYQGYLGLDFGTKNSKKIDYGKSVSYLRKIVNKFGADLET